MTSSRRNRNRKCITPSTGNREESAGRAAPDIARPVGRNGGSPISGKNGKAGSTLKRIPHTTNFFLTDRDEYVIRNLTVYIV